MIRKYIRKSLSVKDLRCAGGGGPKLLHHSDLRKNLSYYLLFVVFEKNGLKKILSYYTLFGLFRKNGQSGQ